MEDDKDIGVTARSDIPIGKGGTPACAKRDVKTLVTCEPGSQAMRTAQG